MRTRTEIFVFVPVNFLDLVEARIIYSIKFYVHCYLITFAKQLFYIYVSDPIVKEQNRLNILSSSPTPIAGPVPAGE